MASIDLVVTDLDGTFWDESLGIHPRTLEAVEELGRRGIELMFATGRRPGTARHGFQRLADSGIDLWRPTILLNGTLGIDYPTDHRFHVAAFDPEAAGWVVEAFAACGHVPCAYTSDGKLHIADTVTTGARHRSQFGHDTILGAAEDIGDGGEVVGYSVIGVELDGLEPLAPTLRELGILVDHYLDPVFGGWSVMAQPPGVSKWTGVLAHLDRSAISGPGGGQPRVLAVGDGGNDAEMLRHADVGVAIQPGDPALLQVADAVIEGPGPTNWDQILDLL